jgi:hypothetical protein
MESRTKTSCTTNNLSNQFTHTTLCIYVLSIILLSSLFASQINKIVSLVNQKLSLIMSLQDIVIFKISQKCLYVVTLYKMP